MPLRRILRASLLAPLSLALVPASAGAAVRFAAAEVAVREGEAAAVTVVRDDASRRGEVRWAVWPDAARTGLDFPRAGGRLDFAPGQRTATVAVATLDDGNVEGRETAKLGLYGAHPERLGRPARARLTIVDDDEVGVERDPRNPLALDPPPPGSNPLAGAPLYRNADGNLAATVIRRIRRRRPGAARMLRVIADEPETKRFGSFTHRPGLAVARFLERAQADEPGTVPLLSTYRLRHVRCGGVSDSPREARRVRTWYRKFARGIGNHRAIVFIEIDGLITTRCLSRRGLRVRIGELRAAIDAIAALPHVVAYVDAGSGLAHRPARIARLLRRVGVHRIQGFFTNATHQNWTSREIRYGRALMRRLGWGPHQVVNTATTGRGPLVPRDRVRHGNSFRCNAPGRGLGPRPTTQPPARYRNVDGFFWIGNPGRSAGRCSKTPNPPPAGRFWLAYALSLVKHAHFGIR